MRAAGLELPGPRGRRFGAGRKSFGEHYLDELCIATRNDTLHGWRPGDPLTTTLEQLEGLNRALVEERRACGPAEKVDEAVEAAAGESEEAAVAEPPAKRRNTVTPQAAKDCFIGYAEDKQRTVSWTF